MDVPLWVKAQPHTCGGGGDSSLEFEMMCMGHYEINPIHTRKL